VNTNEVRVISVLVTVTFSLCKNRRSCYNVFVSTEGDVLS